VHAAIAPIAQVERVVLDEARERIRDWNAKQASKT
jgi:hypothetical protein